MNSRWWSAAVFAGGAGVVLAGGAVGVVATGPVVLGPGGGGGFAEGAPPHAAIATEELRRTKARAWRSIMADRNNT
jgi:hypothetical protein